MNNAIFDFLENNWNSAVEILLLAVAIYYGYLYLRGTRGAKVLTGLAFLFIGLTLISQILNLVVIGWLLRELSAFLAIALVVIFQPELRRALAELGSSRFFSSPIQKKETIDIITDSVFELASKQIGALIAIERNTPIRSFAESGVNIDCYISQELILTIFFPKTPLHDGGVIIRDDRIIAAACIFPVSQREDLDRSLGLRHRAALGITEESDAVAVVVSEETGSISLCFRGRIERGLKSGQFETRLSELLFLQDESSDDDAGTSLIEPKTTA
ncbi:MAG: TIGR00159 family protein [Verrucomicrobia bacterium]|nr:TIGR00159 family protein [Verrucomicrobiota bacterium]MBV9673102.1 TIGR00159 family protein [Verrucomicrobiota bacterium]